MHIGFTGTQRGMTEAQKRALNKILSRLFSKYEGVKYFHHGDCVGADAEAHEIAKALGYLIFGHPPQENSKRAFCEFEESEEPYDYLYRNTRIVKCSEILIATPEEHSEKIRSGTWSTVRRGRKYKKKILIISPEGSVRKDDILTQ